MKMVNTRQQQNYFNYISEKKAKKNPFIHFIVAANDIFFFTFIYSLIHSFVVESVQQKKKNE